MSVATLYGVENPTPADYARARELNPSAVIPAVGEPWVSNPYGHGLMVYAREETGQTGWYYQSGDLFVSDAPVQAAGA